MPFPILLLIDAGFTGATIDMPPLAMAHGLRNLKSGNLRHEAGTVLAFQVI